MPWTELTTAAVDQQWTAEEAAALAALSGGDKVPDVLEKVIAQVREDILAGGFALHATTTFIPEGLHNDAIAITRWKVLIALPGMEELQTKARETEHKEACTKLRDIATGKRKVEPPAGSLGLSGSGTWNAENKFIGRMNPTPRPGPQQAGRYANDDAPADAVE